MSMQRMCDCPSCYDEEHLAGEGYATLGDADVCQSCLQRCRHWRPWGGTPKRTELEKTIDAVFGPLIEQQINAMPLFRKMAGS